jgi:hypothetical protein
MNKENMNKGKNACCAKQDKAYSILASVIEKKVLPYIPLLIVILFSVLLAGAHSYNYKHFSFMYGVMGYFFLFLSMFKLFDLKGFVNGFASYDVIARRCKAYGFLYPFIELFLGGMYIMHINLRVVNVITIVIMAISSVGIMQAVFFRREVKCACLGAVLQVPLTAVSIIENISMALMAAIMLLRG